MNKNDKIYVAGHRGLVGSAIMRALEKEGYDNLVYRTSSELNLRNQEKTYHFFQQERPDVVFLAAAKVGGIMHNLSFPVDFITYNIQIQTNIITEAQRRGVKKLVFLGSSCIYPKLCPQPMKEEHLLTSPLEPTNQWYAIAKIAGIMMCQAHRAQLGLDAISLMPTNLYGPNDNFSLTSSHVLPAMIRKFHDAKVNNFPKVLLWGTGSPKREFLHVDDLADACIFLANNYSDGEIINVGVGEDLSIYELSNMIREIVGYKGNVVWDPAKPDGTPRKLLDVTKIHELGWKAKIDLYDGIKETYEWYVNNQ